MSWTNPKCVKCMAKIKDGVILYRKNGLPCCMSVGDMNICPANFQKDKKCPFRKKEKAK